MRPRSALPGIPRERLRLLALLRHASRPAVAASVLVQLVVGAAPLAFMLSSSAAVGHVRAAAAGGTGSAAWRSLEVAMSLAAAALVVGQVLAPVQRMLAWVIQSRVDVHVHRRLMDANYATPGIAVMERPEVRSALDEAVAGMRRFATPGAAAAASLTLLARYTAFAGALAVVGAGLGWSAAAAAGVGGLVLRVTHRRGANAYASAIVDTIADRRRYSFLSSSAMGTAVGKEARIFGLAGWLADRGEEEGLRYFRTLWAIRSRIFIRPFALAAAVTAAGGALALAGPAWPRGGLPAWTTVLVAQAVIGALGIGASFDESDYLISYGLTCLRHVERVEAAVAAARPAAAPGAVPAVPVGPVTRSIRFEDLVFTYPGADRPVLAGVTLDLEAGTSLAVVGANGAGKTTLVKLLCRFYEPQSGRIRADGVDIGGFDAAQWQRRIAAVFQDFGRYPLPAADNVGFGAAELAADRAAVTRAAERAGADGFLEGLERGLDTTLSRDHEGGTDLSGGQWQRVALARAMLAVSGGASVLILDEPTASMDVRAEAAFIDSFLDLTRGTTTIVVSHRFATVRRADRIVVLDGGRVAEDGTHDELMELGGQYARMFSLQAARFAVATAAEQGDGS
ncbi:ATP-binding cassette domain-containing protein [Streptacidiphilus sp. ASG 303]|uniref:ATP-binding cassette domain-containing protein n=1 Tax=Streptacidiphilus sp. ASG 303 TaxID=2896847 RepID=UPI001E4DB1D7|nr:ATP-binding cassette domain-containing protein [Streptacidiphilus sp. ASG 303]MCD0484148.1 ATP-binding cassette domain-containing protein [Streptacidiphilus sp. ASG 303]